MDVLLVTSNFGAHTNVGFMPLVGAKLAQRGHTVRGIQYEAADVLDAFPVERIATRELYTPYWLGQWLFYKDWLPKIQSRLSELNPDVVVTDRRCMAPTLLAGAELDIPSVGVVPGLGFTRFDPYNIGVEKTPSFWSSPSSIQLQYPFVQRLFDWHNSALNRASAIVVISKYLEDVLRETFSCDSTVVRTPVPLDKVRADSVDPRYLTIVNPRTTLKGSRLTPRIAEQLPDREFQVAGEFASEEDAKRVTELDNVEHLGWVNDMSEVYRKASLVLVPSLVEEGGGPRVVIEGFANGVPAVGTNRGAVPEHIGDAGRIVSDPYDFGEWARLIEDALANRTKLSERARQNATQYQVDKRIDEFETVLQRVIN